MDPHTLHRLREACAAEVRTVPGLETARLVFGDGNDQAPLLMLIGEAPGQQEALQGKPFVGKAGQNLTAFLNAVGLSRDELYISNVVKIRPHRVSAAGRTVNRPPTREEIARFTPWLYREIALVRPAALVTLGNVALRAFVPAEANIGECHGRWTEALIPGEDGRTLRLPLFALYHPAAVIYRRELTAVYQADLERLRATLPNVASR